MASEASWQTSTAAESDNPFPDERRSDHTAPWNKPSYQPIDQHAVEALLQRLVNRFEESERLYGEAIGELHARLDRLSQTTEAGTGTSANTIDRLNTELHDIAQRLESETSTPLDNFDRLGEALAGGLRGDTNDSTADPSAPPPEPSPFAKSVMTSKPRSRLAPELDLAEELEPLSLTPAFTQTPSDPLPSTPALDTQLKEMADRLERSIDKAIPNGTIAALNARLDDIGGRVSTASGTPALEQVESHFADMGRQLAHAETQLRRLDGVEEQLRKLIARLDQTKPVNETLDPNQAKDIAAEAAGNAARLVADGTKKTAERLDAMQLELKAIGETSRVSGDKVVSTLEAVNASLAQLAGHVERVAAANSRTAENDTKTKLTLGDTPSQTRAGSSRDAADKSAETEKERDRMPAFMKAGQSPAPARPEPAKEAVEKPVESALKPAPDDLVAAARKAAQAAAARAEERAGKERTPERFVAHETPNRWRPLLIITAATLLAISAFLLYGRLGIKMEEAGPAVAPSSAPPSSAKPSSTPPSAPGKTAPPAGKPASVPSRAPSVPNARPAPANGASGRGSEIEIGEAWAPSGVALAPVVTIAPGDLDDRGAWAVRAQKSR